MKNFALLSYSEFPKQHNASKKTKSIGLLEVILQYLPGGESQKLGTLIRVLWHYASPLHKMEFVAIITYEALVMDWAILSDASA